MDDFMEVFPKIIVRRHSFLFASQHWDTDLLTPIESTSRFTEALKRHAKGAGLLQTTRFINYFVFPKDLYDEIPAPGRRMRCLGMLEDAMHRMKGNGVIWPTPRAEDSSALPADWEAVCAESPWSRYIGTKPASLG